MRLLRSLRQYTFGWLLCALFGHLPWVHEFAYGSHWIRRKAMMHCDRCGNYWV